jgi:ABC-2 type transport system ATP-binding protein
MIITEKLTKIYGKEVALDNVSLSISTGKLVCLVGPNGSGKSTLIKLILGLISQTSGSVRINGYEPIIGYMPEVSNISKNFRGSDILKILKKGLIGDINGTDELIEIMDMSGYLNKKVGQYSKGMQKKLSLLVAFCNNPNLVILDEPFEGIDTIDRDRLMSFIAQFIEKGNTVLLSTHILHDLDTVCTQAIFLKKGVFQLQFNPKSEAEKILGSNLNDEVLKLFEVGARKSKLPTITDIYRKLYQ